MPKIILIRRTNGCEAPRPAEQSVAESGSGDALSDGDVGPAQTHSRPGRRVHSTLLRARTVSSRSRHESTCSDSTPTSAEWLPARLWMMHGTEYTSQISLGRASALGRGVDEPAGRADTSPGSRGAALPARPGTPARRFRPGHPARHALHLKSLLKQHVTCRRSARLSRYAVPAHPSLSSWAGRRIAPRSM